MLELVTPATELAVSLADAKLHLRVTHSSEDALITSLIHAATRHAESLMQRAVLEQEWLLTLPCYPLDRVIRLPRPPVQSVESVEYVDAHGDAQELVEDTDYVVLTATGNSYGLVLPVYGVTWPTPRYQANAVRVSYTCGYASPAAIPPDIVAAIKLLLATLYENREEYVVGGSIGSVPLAAKHLLAPHVVYSFGDPNLV